MPLELGDPAPVPDDPSVYESGLFFQNGKAKKIATAYKFPFVVQVRGKHLIQVWGRSPAGGRLKIETRLHGRWHMLRTISAGRWKVFSVTLTGPTHSTLRGVVGTEVSLPWKEGAYRKR
jgi:hypothetical protein